MVESAMERAQPVLVVALRILLGMMLALALGVIGIGIAWTLFVFSGASSRIVMLSMLIGGAGIGAGIGSFAAWIRLQGDTPFALLTLALLASSAGIAGAWGGFQYGAGVEVACCAMPSITPMSYTAGGAIVAANGVALLIGLGREFLVSRRRANQRLLINQ